MPKVFVSKIISLLLVIVTLTSCTAVKLQLPEAKKPVLEKYVWANEAHSNYYYSQLEEHLKEPYEILVEACLSLTAKVTVPRVTAEELTMIIRAVIRDYPIINWLADSYSFAKSFDGKTVVELQYTKNQTQVNLELEQLNTSTTKLLADISPDLSDYEKALLAHDKLVRAVTYDLESANQRIAYGAIAENRATCEGYAKAYQFLLLKMNIESIVVYGMVEEPHAWNIVQLDGDYYYADSTFDDRSIANGGTYLSREYLFITDEQLKKTHSLSIEDVNHKLPSCTATKENYFVKNGSLITSVSSSEIKKIAKRLALVAIKNRDTSFQIRFATDDIATVVSQSMFDNGVLDQAVSIEVSRYQNVNYTGRTFEQTTNVLTFLLDYTKK